MVLVFIHGIFSSPVVFDKLKESIGVGCKSPHKFVDFEYKYLDPLMDNAARLNMFLIGSIDPARKWS